MPESTSQTTRFVGPEGRAVEATFDGGRLTSDGGIAFVEADQALGLCTALAACVRSGSTARSSTAWPPWYANRCSRLPAAMPIRTMPICCAPIRC